MTLLVTGTAGFIGSAFVRLLFGKGRRTYPIVPSAFKKIVSLDNLSYASSLENLAAVANDARHVFVKGDICDAALVEQLVREHQISGIINFAAESHVDRSIESSEPFVRANVFGTVTLLDAARRHGLRYLQVSTDEVYGALRDEDPKFTEETPLAPNSPYSASKAAADCFVRAYFETHRVATLITRCTNNYGPHQFPEKFLPLALSRLLTGQQIPVYGTGLNTRDWIHVEDHAFGVWLAYTQGQPGNIYNFGGFGERRNLEVARKLCELVGQSEEQAIRYVEDRKGHDWRYAVNPAKVIRELGWQPQWNVDEGFADTLSWYRENRGWWQSKLS